MNDMVRWALPAVAGLFLWAGCADRPAGPQTPRLMAEVPDTRTPIHLPPEAGRAHRDVMMQHLETVQVLVGALADADFKQAKEVTEAHLGFFARRHVAAQQAPPAYRDLAIAHYQAGQELAKIIPSKEINLVLPRLNGWLRTCMGCHLEYKVESGTSR
jgi:hypothetical protein